VFPSTTTRLPTTRAHLPHHHTCLLLLPSPTPATPLPPPPPTTHPARLPPPCHASNGFPDPVTVGLDDRTYGRGLFFGLPLLASWTCLIELRIILDRRLAAARIYLPGLPDPSVCDILPPTWLLDGPSRWIPHPGLHLGATKRRRAVPRATPFGLHYTLEQADGGPDLNTGLQGWRLAGYAPLRLPTVAATLRDVAIGPRYWRRAA